MKFIGIIPARYASSRFPGKPLAMLGGKPMIQHVYERVVQVLEAVVATDDQRIFDAVKAFGGNVVMTSPSHPSGTDRCREAYTNFGKEADVVINIQGDEPFIHPSQIQSLMECFSSPEVDIATLVRPFSPERGFEALQDPNTPKVVVADNGDALYFSRSVVPYVRGRQQEEWPYVHSYFTHVGIYAFRVPVLEKIVNLPRSPLEIAESLEQLRWLQGGYRIRTAVTQVATVGIDTPADLQAAEKMLQEMIPDRTTPPPTADCPPVCLKEETVETLANGIRFHIVNSGNQEVLRLALFCEGGLIECVNPAAHSVALDSIYEATADYDAPTLADIIDFNGARIGTRNADHYTGIELLTLNSRVDELLPVLASVVQHPRFNDEAVDVSSRKLAASCATRLEKVEVRSADRLRQLMLGEDHMGARIIMPDHFKNITHDDCMAAVAGLNTAVSHAFLGGSLSDSLIEKVRNFLLELPGESPSGIKVVPFSPAPPVREHITVDGALQTGVAMGLPAIGRHHPDYNALRLAVVALGGYFGSRLMNNIREEKGLTYGIDASLYGMQEGSYVGISARCSKENVEQLVEETIREIRNLGDNPPRDEELRRLRLYVWSRLNSAADSSLGTLEYYISNLMIGAPNDYFNNQLAEIASITPERIREVARKYLDPGRLTIITAGA